MGDPRRALTAERLLSSPNPLADHYRRFRVAERLLLTGHSHQAWPDCAREGQLAAWNDAAEHVDAKWERAFERADRVRAGFARLLDDPDGRYALGGSVHELLVRFLSSLPLTRRRRVVTTDGEFHSASRQLRRLEEEGLEVHRVASLPSPTVGERLADAVDDSTAVVLTSTVFYDSGRIAGGLEAAAEACRHHGAELLLDLYHQLDAVPFSLRRRGLEDAFAVGGGYKYCQLGEGNCFLRFPADREHRPVVTGWFASFDTLESAAGDAVRYGPGHWCFAGSTYDPTSHYRASAVFDFFAEHGLEPPLLRAVSQAQIGLLCELFDELDLPPELLSRDRAAPIEELGGFLCLASPRAGEISRRLAAAGVLTDFRGRTLRLGPAPYLSTDQLRSAIGVLGEVVGALAR